jgi:hypothetical protein
MGFAISTLLGSETAKQAALNKILIGDKRKARCVLKFFR